MIGIAGCRCREFQHHKNVQTIISYEYLQKERAEKSKRKESEPQEDTDQKADEDKAQGDVREGQSLPNTHDLNPTREAPYRVV